MTGGSPDHDDGVGDDLREVLLTLTAAEFERFASDLRLLRHHHAEGNGLAFDAYLTDGGAGD